MVQPDEDPMRGYWHGSAHATPCSGRCRFAVETEALRRRVAELEADLQEARLRLAVRAP